METVTHTKLGKQNKINRKRKVLRHVEIKKESIGLLTLGYNGNDMLAPSGKTSPFRKESIKKDIFSGSSSAGCDDEQQIAPTIKTDLAHFIIPNLLPTALKVVKMGHLFMNNTFTI
ncbi:MAG: hypothetical protein KDE51_03315 [Anaerolineales bacterium]|nr:hypothetical protein [Anaerolineales bacterium]